METRLNSRRGVRGRVPAGSRRLRSALVLCAALLAACGQQQSPEGALSTQASYTVTNTNSSGSGSLRAAMEAANASPEDDVITFGALGDDTIRLEGSDLSAFDSGKLTIRGPGSRVLTISGQKLSRIFYIRPRAVVEISGLTLFNGYSGNRGGAIYNESGDLTLKDVIISDGEAAEGGGIYSTVGAVAGGGKLTLIDTIILYSSASGRGGGVFNDRAPMSMTDSGVIINTAGEGGGGIYNTSEEVNITNSTVAYNRAQGSGGGIYNLGTLGVINLLNTTLNNNTAGGDGGGVYTLAGTVNVKNTTVSTNTATRGGGFGVHRLVLQGPRWVDLLPSKLYLTNATVTDNTASGAGGGVFNDYSEIYLGNTILAGNFAPQGTPNDYAVISPFSTFGSQGHNLFGGTPETATLAEGDLIAPDPKLGPLTENGGPTLTHALLPGSPAINAGSNVLASGLSTDQRGEGFPRIVGGTVDIGALELQTLPPSAPSVTVDQADGQADPTGTSPILFTAVFSEAVEGFSGEDVTLGGTAGASSAVVSGSGATYTVAVSGMTGSGTVTVSIPAGAATDAQGDANTASTSTDNTVTYNAPPSDSTPPEITPNVTGTLGQNGWYTGDVSVSWTVTDDESAVSNTNGCDPATVASDTAGVSFTCEAMSAGGTASESVTVKRDATAPSLNPTVTPNPALQNGSATASAGATDALSGVATQSCESVNTSRAGSYSVRCTATDNAGNSATASASYTVTASAPAPLELLSALSSQVRSLNLHRATERALLTQLSAAQRLLVRDRDAEAVQTLKVFIKTVDALKGKPKVGIRPADAVALKEAAREVIAAIRAQ